MKPMTKINTAAMSAPITKLNHALALAAQGFWLFPLKPNARTPAHVGWQTEATIDRDKVRSMFEGTDCGIGIFTGKRGDNEALLVVDVDLKNGKNGDATLFEQGITLPPTRTHHTLSGGRHHIYRVAHPVRGSAGKIGEGIDIRSAGGLVVAWLGDSVYRVEDGPVNEAPAWLVELCGTARDTVAVEVSPELRAKLSADGAQELCTARAIERLKADPVAIYGGRNERTYERACAVKNCGVVDCHAAVALVAEYGECEPPLDFEEIARTVMSAYDKDSVPLGSELPPQFEFEKLRVPFSDMIRRKQAALESGKTTRKRAKFLTMNEANGMVFDPPAYVWGDRLLAHDPNLYTGDAGVGKTTLAENLATHVSAGAPMLGFPTIQMPVLLVVAEDRYGIVRDNINAIASNIGLNADALPIHLLSVKSDRQEGGHMIATISDEGRVTPTPFVEDIADKVQDVGPCLVIFDPLAEFVAFDRNQDAPCRALASVLLGTMVELNGGRTTVLFNDHPSKASMSSGYNVGGSTQLKAAFALVATLKKVDPKPGAPYQQFDFEVLKGRYAGETVTRLYRVGGHPAYSTAPAPGHTDVDVRDAVLDHVLARIDAGQPTHKTNRGDYGPEAIYRALAIGTEGAVVSALRGLERDGLLTYRANLGKGRPAGYERGLKCGEPGNAGCSK
jgi:Bifunctional DNA primase/polymerase, N-terminal/AAA domain